MNRQYDRDQCARVLGVAADASQDEIKRAYRRLARTWHPDRHERDRKAQHRAHLEWVRVQVAYETLCGERAAVPKTVRAAGARAAASGSSRRHGAALAVTVSALALLLMVAIAVGPGGDREVGKPERSADGSTKVAASGLDGSTTDAPAVPESPLRFDAAGNPIETPASASVPTGDTEVRSIADPIVQRPATFWLGSTPDDVRAAQGKPDAILGRLWVYGIARVRFVANRVDGWDDRPRGALAIRVPPHVRELRRSLERDDALFFSTGSSVDEVAAVMGPPTSINATLWRYGSSFVRFRGDAVSSFDSAPSFPLLTRPATSASTPGAP